MILDFKVKILQDFVCFPFFFILYIYIYIYIFFFYIYKTESVQNINKIPSGFLDFKVKLQRDYIYFLFWLFLKLNLSKNFNKIHPNTLNLSLQLLDNIDRQTDGNIYCSLNIAPNSNSQGLVKEIIPNFTTFSVPLCLSCLKSQTF